MSASVATGSAAPGSSLTPKAPAAPGSFPWRVLHLFNIFRFAISLILLVIFFAIREPRILGEVDASLTAQILIAMLAFASVEHFALHRRWPNLPVQIYGQLCFDLATIALLMHASGGITSGVGGLLVVSVGTLALLVPLDRALFFAALTTFVLLGEQTLAVYRDVTDSTDFTATGILGAVIFIITGIVQLLRKQIVETEALAEQRGVDLRNQVELNDYIIQHLRESIVVVDRHNRLRLLNESAAGLLGARGDVRGRALGEFVPDLEMRLRRWRQGEDSHTESTFLLEHGQSSTHVQPHFARLGPDRHGGVVMFLEDTSLIFDRVQQTKLAALGRLSAGIAHEIRNPLGALSHAGQLLAESASISPEEKRLTDIIMVNSERVSQIVDSVLSLSRSEKAKPERIRLKDWVHEFCGEFVETQELYEGAVSLRPDSVDLEAEMDRTHLRQVVWNLCDNAVKYASAAAGAIAVELQCGTLETSGRPYLDVIDSGPGIEPEMAEQIFEPFYTAQPGGTGLGLYISRELCERNGAGLRYYPRHGGGSVFRIIFADPNRW